MIRKFFLLALVFFGAVSVNAQKKSNLPFGHRMQHLPGQSQVSLKSAALIRQKMDSLKWMEYDTVKGWFLAELDRFAYDAEGKLIQANWYDNYYFGPGEFGYRTDTLSYYPDGKLHITTEYARRSESEPWEFLNKVVVSYDAAGNDTLKLYYGPDALGREQYSYKQTQTFNYGGNLMSSTVYNWSVSDTDWIPWIRSVNAYDSVGRILSTVEDFWNSEGKSWESGLKHTYSYDLKGSLTEDQWSTWDIAAGSWNPQSKNTHSYDSLGFESLSLGHTYDPVAGTWTNDYRLEMEYDMHGNLLHHQELGNMDSTGEWTYRTKADYRFNLDYLADELALPFEWQGKVPAHMYLGLTSRIWDHAKRVWVDQYNADYFYSAFSGSGTHFDTQFQPIRVYPNPVSDFVVIETGPSAKPVRFTLTDPSGKLVRSALLNGSRNQVALDGLPGGLYLYRIDGDGISRQGKVVKR